MNTSPNNETPTTPPLNMQTIQSIGKSYARLIELRDQKIMTPTTESEVRGLIEFLSSTLLEHTSEFLACWLVARTEYEPLLSNLARIMLRVDSLKGTKQSIVVKPSE